MKTNANVTTKKQAINEPATLKKVSVNSARSPFKDSTRKPENRLNIQGYELRQWLEHMNGSVGAYFLDMEIGQNGYSLHFKHNNSGKLMEMEYLIQSREPDDPRKDFLEALIFDLSLFADEPILVLDSDLVENMLKNLGAIYYEHSLTIDNIIARLVNMDLKTIFGTGIYQDSRIKDISIDGIYQVLYPGTSRHFKEQASYGIYLIYLAMENVFYQIIGKRTMARV